MSTGAKHNRTTEISYDDEGSEMRRYFVPCRCTVGEDHNDDVVVVSQFEADEDEDHQVLSASDAADIWISRGMDDDYTFGYSEDELRKAAE